MSEVYRINVKPQTHGERGLPKVQVAFTRLLRSGLEGDFNRYRHEKKNDTSDWAVLVLPLETIQQLNKEGWPVKPGDLGENITIQGVPYEALMEGSVWQIGNGAKIQISGPCTPCTNLYELPYVGKENGPRFIKTLLNRRGMFARVLKEGVLRSADPFVKIS